MYSNAKLRCNVQSLMFTFVLNIFIVREKDINLIYLRTSEDNKAVRAY